MHSDLPSHFWSLTPMEFQYPLSCTNLITLKRTFLFHIEGGCAQKGRGCEPCDCHLRILGFVQISGEPVQAK